MIAYSTQLIEQDDIDAVVETLKSSSLTQGPKVVELEESLCSTAQTKYALAFNSATSALHAAYFASGIEAGNEVVTSPITFAATSNMIIALGAKPVFVDVKLDGNIDERSIEAAITPKTKAIVPIHFSGKPVAISKILDIAKKHNLVVIEDGAHALGAKVDGVPIGSFGDATIFSFHAIKPVTTGEGGALVTNNKEIYERAKLFRSHGIEKGKLWSSSMEHIGYNYRMSDIAASLGVSQLKKLERFNARRNEIAKIYDNAFKNSKFFYTSTIEGNLYSARHLYFLLLKPELYCSKEDIFQALHSRGIGVQVHYKPLHKFTFYERELGLMRLRGAEEFYKAELSIPCHQKMSNEDADYVIETINKVAQSYSHKVCST